MRPTPLAGPMGGRETGAAAVALARWAVETHLGQSAAPRPTQPTAFARPGGAFVTLNAYPERRLRGCIGFPRPDHPLGEAVERAAVGACHDPRFPPLTPEDLDAILVEVSLLTPPRRVEVDDPRGYREALVPGRHGLVVEHGVREGLLLPQVAADEGWSPADFLAHACLKAGLLPDAWFEPGIRISTFRAEVFAEERPRGPVLPRALQPVHDGH